MAVSSSSNGGDGGSVDVVGQALQALPSMEGVFHDHFPACVRTYSPDEQELDLPKLPGMPILVLLT